MASPRTFLSLCAPRGLWLLGMALLLSSAPVHAQSTGPVLNVFGPGGRITVPPATPKLPRPRALAQPTADSISVAYQKGQAPIAPDAITPLGTDLFGDKINLFNGSFSFEHTDVELPGNNALPVALVRRHVPGRQPLVRGAMGDWDVQTPRIEGSFSVAAGWVPAYGSPANRCSGFNMPPDVSVQTVDGAFDFAPYEYWHGTHLSIPGQGNQEILTRAAANPQAPTDGNSYPLVTAQSWQIGCLASVQNASGQGFFAVSPQGVRYRFDWMASRAISSIRKGTYLPRRDFYLMATEVSDRFGNWVRYSYDPANPLHLTRIESNDGRVITLGYTGGRVSSVWDGTRTWLYSYAATTDLQSVQLPDGSRWQFNLRPLMDVNPSINEAFPDCDSDPAVGNLGGVGSITHPSGAVGTFAATMLMHGRTNVTRVCTYDLVSGWTNGNVWPRVTINLGLVSKQISGPGMATMTWVYASGGPGQGEWAPCSTCMDRRVITVTEPSGAITRHSFGILWRVNEGQLLRVEEGWNGTSALRTTDYSYQSASGQPFPDGFGDSVDFMTDWVSTRNRPLRTKQIAQQGVGFNWTANSFDFRARPVTVTKAGPGSSRVETTGYQDFTVPWVLGQVASVSSGSTLPVENSYDGLGQLLSHKQFGLVQFTQTYWPDGTLKTRADGKGNTTSFSNYHRGVPRNIAFPLSVSVSGIVNNIGRLTSITDPLGQVTSYDYDAMGRLARITPPGGFNETFISYFRLASASDGLPAGTWVRTIATGSAHVRTYYDEMWRVVMTSTLDVEWPEATRVDIKRYDAGGRLAFESYALGGDATAATSSPGKRYQYDALNRRVREAADSELGELLTLTEYLNRFETRITNPRGQVIKHSYWALDNPAEALLRGVTYASGPGLPLAVSVIIKRDAFGKPLNISRGESFSSSSRSYVYDAHQRLCKTLEPELIATVQQWDLAGNLAWTAPGVNLPGNTCDPASVPASSKITHSYDALNRLTGTTYGDGGNSINRSYFADGKPQTVNSGGANWTYTYNPLRKLTSESLSYNGQTFTFTRGYNANGHVSSLRYPSGLTLEYTLNGLGQPLEVGTVTGGPGPAFHFVRFHPNGGLKGINDDWVVITQNLRGLPHKWKVDTVLEDEYRYDANGNVISISDMVSGHTNRSMQYDALDRLTSANAPGLWGVATYTYDALDNLRTAHVGSRSVTLGYDTRNRLSSLSGSQSLNYTYDARGNVSSRGNTSFHFDLGNRLLSSGGNSYAYDGHGRRVRIISSDGSTRYQVYSADGQLLWSTNAGGGRPASHTAYVYVAGRLAAEVDSVKGVHYVYTDALGSPVARQSAADWAQRSRTHYEPYGGIAGGTAPSAATSQVGFTGHVQDQETGLVYMQQRYYEPIAGRFLSVDPVVTDAQTGGFFGRYHYANNNPYRFVDLTGMAPTDCGNTGATSCKSDYLGADPAASLPASKWGERGAPLGMTIGEKREVDKMVGDILVDTGVTAASFTPLGRTMAAAKGAAPAIKAGAAGGETAGKPFAQAIRGAAKAENPLQICVFCRREGVAKQVDHAIPRARGGNATLDNAQMACPHCNASKGARDFPVNPPPGYRGEWPPSHWGP